MKILFCGSRSFGLLTERLILIIDAEFQKLNPNKDIIIHGGAIGIDSFVDNLARQKGFVIQVYAPEYNKYGRHATLLRDRQMVKEADKVIGIWDGISAGTIYTLNYAKLKHKPTTVIRTTGR